MAEYVYQEYPKCLYQSNGLTVTVASIDEELDMNELGWQTAEQFYSYTPIVHPDSAESVREERAAKAEPTPEAAPEPEAEPAHEDTHA
jgi:hypothetical protein